MEGGEGLTWFQREGKAPWFRAPCVLQVRQRPSRAWNSVALAVCECLVCVYLQTQTRSASEAGTAVSAFTRKSPKDSFSVCISTVSSPQLNRLHKSVFSAWPLQSRASLPKSIGIQQLREKGVTSSFRNSLTSLHPSWQPAYSQKATLKIGVKAVCCPLDPENCLRG